MSSRPKKIYSTQPDAITSPKLPWNLDLGVCAARRAQGRTKLSLDEPQISFQTLPLVLRNPVLNWHPPVFHYGYVFDDDELDRLCARRRAEGNKYPGLDEQDFYTVQWNVDKIIMDGYMKTSTALCWDVGKDKDVFMFSIATNYWPWVQRDRMALIHEFLGEDLGEPRWLVDKQYALWSCGPWLDDEMDEIVVEETPYKFFTSY